MDRSERLTASPSLQPELARETLDAWVRACGVWGDYWVAIVRLAAWPEWFDLQARLLADLVCLGEEAATERLQMAGLREPLLNDA